MAFRPAAYSPTPCFHFRASRHLDQNTRIAHKSRLQTGASPSPIDIEDLRALVVPVRASLSAAPEMSPEEEPLPYPSMSEVSSAMWCEYDNDDDSGDDNSGGGGGGRKQRLRISVQTLDGHVCDDEDEDSETDDGDSDTDRDETDGENETDKKDGNHEGSFDSTPSFQPGRKKRKESNARGVTSRRASGGVAWDWKRRVAKGERKPAAGAEAREWSKTGEDELDEIGYQRKEELASVLRRLRAAVRLMDGILTEEKVSSSGLADGSYPLRLLSPFDVYKTLLSPFDVVL